MAGETPKPPHVGHEPGADHRSDSRELVTEPAREGEHVGPVAIARHVKADGRALILYTRDAPPAA
jgi:hypothetical protein